MGCKLRATHRVLRRKGDDGLRIAALALALTTSAAIGVADEKPKEIKCNEDAMLVFDASGSMSGNERLGIGSVVTRIDKVRKALEAALPNVTPHRRIGLITYGPGPYNRCDNIALNLSPQANAGPRIMAEVSDLIPAGRTPLTSAVEHAAEVLDYKHKAALVVLLTDGEETCGRQPCALAKSLKASGANIVVHVIGYRMHDFSWTGGQGIFDVQCMARETGGDYISADSVDDLIAALNKTLGCPIVM